MAFFVMMSAVLSACGGTPSFDATASAAPDAGAPDAAGASCAEGTWDHDVNPSTRCVPWTACAADTYASAAGSAIDDRTCAASASA